MELDICIFSQDLEFPSKLRWTFFLYVFSSDQQWGSRVMGEMRSHFVVACSSAIRSGSIRVTQHFCKCHAVARHMTGSVPTTQAVSDGSGAPRAPLAYPRLGSVRGGRFSERWVYDFSIRRLIPKEIRFCFF